MKGRIARGCVFRRVYRDRKGKRRRTGVWYIRYYVKGDPVTLATGTQDHDEAVALLRQKMASLPREDASSKHPERVRMSQLFDLVLEQYRMKGRKSIYDVERKIESRLRPYFGHIKAQDVTSAIVRKYIDSRRRDTPSPQNASINRELAYVRLALHLGTHEEPPLVLRVPHFEFLPEDNVRTGTLTHHQYKDIRDLLPNYARVALVIAYHTGARKGELRQICRDQIDFRAGRIELQGRTTKNGRSRYLPIYGEMRSEIEIAMRAADPNCPYLIQRDGRPVFDFEKSWAAACAAAKVEGALFHDLRRTALTNMIEAGLSEKEAMEISGHRTRAVFDRYHIVSEQRLREMGEKLGVHLRRKDQLSRSNKGAKRDV